jgi:glucose-1-phosphate cytidylyltransferase
MRTVILCGGKGTRAYPHTAEVPKPLLEVDGRPVLRHLMDIYAAQGFRDFVLAAGFKQEMVRAFAEGLPADWQVTVVDTGESSGTGSRLAQCRSLAGETFFATYADGLGDVDLAALLAFHTAHPGTATVTTAPLRSQYGTVESEPSGRVERFAEKPVLAGKWINAGFFVFDQAVFDRWDGDDLEAEVLPGLCETGQLYAFRHEGFWRSMDTYKDALELTELCAGGRAPWLRSAASASS